MGKWSYRIKCEGSAIRSSKYHLSLAPGASFATPGRAHGAVEPSGTSIFEDGVEGLDRRNTYYGIMTKT